jgi:hypothetical protein
VGTGRHAQADDGDAKSGLSSSRNTFIPIGQKSSLRISGSIQSDLREEELAHDTARSELDQIKRHIREIIEAVKNGLRSPSLAAELDRLVARKAELERRPSKEPKLLPRFRPNLAGVYK